MLMPSSLQLAKGTRLGPYEVVGPIGAGGMGEVYHARDTRLARDVAIKILAADLFDDPAWRTRFERESRAIASLNHPNICAVYDVGTASLNGGVAAPFIVMEYLEGETLENRLKRGPLPIDEALRLAKQIADALEKAHRKQILHRDLKPANIMVTKTGARLFDFGLAKFLRRPQSASEETPLSEQSTAEKSLTADGGIVGTLDYMSPEQLLGTEADARTDVFSFGVCLYQVVTGKRPFQGTSRAGLIAAILDHDPPAASRLRDGIPPALDWLITQCLAKDPDDRIQTAHDIALELERIAHEPTMPTAMSAGVRLPAWLAVAFAGFVAIALISFVLFNGKNRAESKQSGPKRFAISLPADVHVAEGEFEKLAVSADGSQVAVVGGKNPTKLYLYSLETQQTRELPATDGARGPFFSPRGDWIGFYTDDHELRKVAVRGGDPVVLCSVGDLRGATWGSDDTIIFAELHPPLRRVSANGGVPEPISFSDSHAQIRWPEFVAGGQYLLYTANDPSGNYENADLAIAEMKTGASQVVVHGATFGRYASGRLLYLHSGAIYAIPFDEQRRAVSGAPKLLLQDADFYSPAGLAHFAVAADGSLFYVARPLPNTGAELVWTDRSGHTVPVLAQRKDYGNPKLSPDGKMIVMEIGNLPRQDIWSYDLDRQSWRRLTSEGVNVNPVWSADGSQIAYTSDKGGGFHLYAIRSDGRSPAVQLTSRQPWDFATSWSADDVILTVEQSGMTLRDIFAVQPHVRSSPTAILASRFDESDAVFSPDGRWMAYRSNESGRDEIYVQPYPPTGQRQQISAEGGTFPVWRRDGKELFYRFGKQLMAAETRFVPVFSASKPKLLFKGDFDTNFDVSADGQRFLMVKLPKQPPRTEIKVVLGLFNNP